MTLVMLTIILVAYSLFIAISFIKTAFSNSSYKKRFRSGWAGSLKL